MSNKTKTDTTTQESKNKLDPRMDALLYGDGTNQGLTQRAQTLANQPAINDRMRQGLDSQANYLQSPLYQAIFNKMLGAGSGMMDRGVAANPYASRMGSMGFGSGMSGGQGYSPNYTQAPQSQTAQQPQTQAPAPQQQAQPQQSQLTPEMLAYLQQMMSQRNNGGA